MRIAPQAMEDIVVIHLTKGSDFFVVVGAKLDLHHLEETRKIYRLVTVHNPICRDRESSHDSKSSDDGTAALLNPKLTKSGDENEDDEDADDIASWKNGDEMSLEQIYKWSWLALLVLCCAGYTVHSLFYLIWSSVTATII